MTLIGLVIPSGGGKTTLARNYGFLDIDVGARESNLGRLVGSLTKLAFVGLLPWNVTNTVQWSFIKNVLQHRLEGDDVVILLHSIAAARAIDCGSISVYVPGVNLHEEATSARSDSARDLARLNRTSVLAEADIAGVEVFEYLTFADLERKVQQLQHSQATAAKIVSEAVKSDTTWSSVI